MRSSGESMSRWVVRTRHDVPADVIRRCHAAMRLLVDACRTGRRPLPVMPVLLVSPTGADAHLAAPSGAAPAPWETRRLVWSVSGAHLDDVDLGTDDLEAYPALVPLGLTADGRGLAVDLGAASGAVDLVGTSAQVTAQMRRLAGALTSSPWSRGVRVTDLADGHLGEVVENVPVLGGVHGRWGAPARDRHHVVLARRPLSDDEHAVLRRAAQLRHAPTVVAPATSTPRGRWRWDLTEEGLTW